jgi:TRAP-type mannitol/chloroaromatic compound transport system substrate-binding protein
MAVNNNIRGEVTEMKNRAKVIVSLLAIVVMVGFVAWPCAAAEFNLKAISSWPAGIGLQTLAEKQYKMIEAYSGGRIKIKSFTAGEIVPGLEVWEAIGKGIADLGNTCNCYSIGDCYASSFGCATPGIREVEKVTWFKHGGGMELLRELMKKTYGVHTFISQPDTTETFLYSKKPINNLNDLKALKIRSVGLRGDVFKKMGCSVVALAGGEIVPALERGAIDAAEFTSMSVDLPLGIPEAAGYVYISDVAAGASNPVLPFNMKTWNKLPKDLQEVVERASWDAAYAAYGLLLVDTFYKWKVAEEKYKIKVRMVHKDVSEAIKKAAFEMYDMKSKTDPDFARLWSSLKKWHDSYEKYLPIYELIP